ncbi:hypothetical protein RJ55_04601 [Drechmeria coniospora]|nr:hypothetical protein RJ55_04601 [Drechmeria coniospora]
MEGSTVTRGTTGQAHAEWEDRSLDSPGADARSYNGRLLYLDDGSSKSAGPTEGEGETAIHHSRVRDRHRVRNSTQRPSTFCHGAHGWIDRAVIGIEGCGQSRAELEGKEMQAGGIGSG